MTIPSQFLSLQKSLNPVISFFELAGTTLLIQHIVRRFEEAFIHERRVCKQKGDMPLFDMYKLA
jgi:hypothetical protein